MKQVQDHYFRKAKQSGYAARSAFKLEQIDRKQRLLRPGQHILDLGAAPGSWMQLAAERVGPRGLVVGIDLQPITAALPDHTLRLQGDAGELDESRLPPAAAPFQGIISDMAPRTTGIPSADAARSAELVLQCLSLAERWLAPGGFLLAKVFQGSRLPELRQTFRERFDKATLEKPKASRQESVEIFLLGLGYRATDA